MAWRLTQRISTNAPYIYIYDFHTGVAFLIFFVGFAITGVGGCFNARQLSKAMSTDVPAAIRVEINQ